MAAGYAATPAARKLGIKPGSVLLLVGAPARWSLPYLPADVALTRSATVPARSDAGPDVVLAFCAEAARLAADITGLAELIFPDAAVWIAWPRKAAGHVSDVTENLIREVALPLGLVDNKVAAIDTDWSGLRLCWRRELR